MKAFTAMQAFKLHEHVPKQVLGYTKLAQSHVFFCLHFGLVLSKIPMSITPFLQ